MKKNGHEKTRTLLFAFLAIELVLAAIFSKGFFHADEHFQLIEFALHKANLPSSLPWEFNAQIRPCLQATMAFLSLKILHFLNIYNADVFPLALRLLSAACSFLVLYKLSLYYFSTELKETRSQFMLLLIVLSLWYLPFLSVRFSSELWSGNFFLLGMLQVIQNKKNNFSAGILWGIAFWFRFQIAFAIIGVLIWLLLKEKNTLRKISQIALGGFLMFIAGIAIDSWFYGNFTVSPWNYFYVNIVQDISSNYGTHAFLEYIAWLMKKPLPFVSLPLFAGILVYAYRKPLRPEHFAVFIFILAHSLIKHKEFRFLFPLLFLSPIYIHFGFQLFKKKKTQTLMFLLFLGLNLPIGWYAFLAKADASNLSFRTHLKKGEVILSNAEFNWLFPDYYFKDYPLRFFKTAKELDTLIQEHPEAKLLIHQESLNTKQLLKTILNYTHIKSKYKTWQLRILPAFVIDEKQNWMLLKRNDHKIGFEDLHQNSLKKECRVEEKKHLNDSIVCNENSYIKTSKQNPFALNTRIKQAEKGAIYRISVKRKGNRNSFLVVSGKSSKDFYLTQNKGKKLLKDWEELELTFYIPFQKKPEELSIYVWNPSEEVVFFKDLTVVKLKQNILKPKGQLRPSP